MQLMTTGPAGDIHAEASPMRGASGRRWQRRLTRYFEVVARERTWRNFLYLMLSFPLGTAYFTVLVTLIAVGGGTAITLVGLPLLVATVYGWCYVAAFERWLANRLLGTEVTALNFERERSQTSVWGRLKARLSNEGTWRSLAFLFARFPQGVISLVVVSTALGVSGGLIGMPAIAQIGRDGSSGANLGIWDVDTWREGFLLVPIGVLLLPLAFHAMNGWAFCSGKMAEAILGRSQPGDGVIVARFDAAADAAAGWTGVRLQTGLAPEKHRLQRAQVRAFAVHFASIAAVATVFFLINALTTPGMWWFLWVLWPMSFALAAHAGYLLYGWTGAHAGFFSIIILGLFIIDAVYSENVWFYWVALPWLPLLALHVGLDHLWRKREARRTVQGVTGPGVASTQSAAVTYHAQDVAVAEAISVEIAMRRVTVDGVVVELTPKEFDLLVLLVQNPGRPFSRDELLDRVWRNEYEITDRTVDTHVQRLRKKLGAQADAIQTVWGVGYRYQG